MSPKRIQMSRKRPWRAENPDAVIVARPSRWGNPFPIDEYGRELAVEMYRQALSGNWNPSTLDQSESDAYWDLAYQRTMQFRERIGGMFWIHAVAKADLGGRDLACWCPLDELCHADVLLEYANRS
jgi:hypothetical protein